MHETQGLSRATSQDPDRFLKADSERFFKETPKLSGNSRRAERWRHQSQPQESRMASGKSREVERATHRELPRVYGNSRRAEWAGSGGLEKSRKVGRRNHFHAAKGSALERPKRSENFRSEPKQPRQFPEAAEGLRAATRKLEHGGGRRCCF